MWIGLIEESSLEKKNYIRDIFVDHRKPPKFSTRKSFLVELTVACLSQKFPAVTKVVLMVLRSILLRNLIVTPISEPDPKK